MAEGKTLRIFISSPGDVAEERDRAKSVVEELRRRYAGRLDLRAVLWEDLPLEAVSSFQQGIDLVLSARGVDIAIFILWSRLGSPIGALIRKTDGAEYRSGTEREWDLMWRAHEQSGVGRPHIIVYTRNDESSFDERLRGLGTADKVQLLQQKKLVEQFITEEFHDSQANANVRAYHRFDRPTTFAQRLRVHLENLLDELAGGTLTTPVWDIEKSGPPFLGLEAFDCEQAPVFFGREDENVAVRQLLREQARRGCAFVLITGASGSGKSSLARAGVLPAICTYEIDSEIDGWRRAVLTPSEGDGDLRLALTRALVSDTALPELGSSADAVAQLATDFAGDDKSLEMLCRRVLRPALEAAGRRSRLIILVDQLEELFTDARLTAEIRHGFLRALEALARSGFVWVLATIRSDFYAQCQSLDPLVRMKEGGGQYDLVPPGADALNRLIRQPAALAGLHFEPRGDTSLADDILGDATAHRELLPLLEYLLHRLCAERTASGMLTVASYEALGGVKGALAKRADAVIAELRPSETAIDTLLSALVTLSGDEQESFVRRHAPRAEVERDEASRVLVATLIRERLLTSAASTDGQAMITVAHEALFRVWPYAVSWLERNREFVRLRANVSQSFARWQGGARDKSLLLPPGILLDEAGRLLAIEAGRLDTAIREYIFASLEETEEKAWRATLTKGGDEAMRTHWERLDGRYATTRQRVLLDLLAHGTVNERRNAATLLGRVSEEPLNGVVTRLLLSDTSEVVCRAAATSLVRLDDTDQFASLATHTQTEGDRARALGALAWLLVAADTQVEARGFDRWYRNLPPRLRWDVRWRAWLGRLRMAVPVFFAVTIPATVFAVAAAMAFKWFPSYFNYAYGQADPGAVMGLFHAATAAILIGGSSAVGLTLYRMVFGREHVRCHYFKPFGAIVAGALFGAIGGLLCDVAIAGVFRLDGLQVMGWVDRHAVEKPAFWQFMSDLFFQNNCGWPFLLNGAGVGIGMAITTNQLRGRTSWQNFLDNNSESSLSSLPQAGKILHGLFKLALPYAGILPLALFLTSMIGLGTLQEKGMASYSGDWRQTLAGGISGEITTNEKKYLDGPALTQLGKDRQTFLREWKTSRFGRAVGIGCDALTKAIGGFFAVVGMGFGIIVLRSGINIERRKGFG